MGAYSTCGASSEVNPPAVINSLPEWVLAARDGSENSGTKRRSEMRGGQLQNNFQHQMMRGTSVVWDKGFS